jgi:coproporphyrinogen III oxidase-like Fe-S oxidoreductase
MGPDVIRVHRFEAAGSDLARQGLRQTPDDFEECRRVIGAAEPLLAEAGFKAMDGDTVYARSESRINLHTRNRYARSGSVAAFGIHASGHVFGRMHYASGEEDERRKALLRRDFPPYRACPGDLDTEMREFMVRNLKAGVDRSTFHKLFGRPVGEVFARELAVLSEQELVETDEESIRPRFGTGRDAVVASMAFYPDELLSELCRLHLGAPYPVETTGSETAGHSAEDRP